MSLLAGVALATLSAVALATQSLGVRLVSAGTPLRDVLTVVFVVNVLVLGPIGAADAVLSGAVPTATGALAFAVAGVLGSLLGRVCYFVGIARLGASRAEPLKSLLPLVAVGGAVLVLGESLSPPLLAGTALLVVGAVVVASDARQSPVNATGRQLWIDVAFPLAAAVLYGIDPVLTKLGLESGGSALVGVALRVGVSAAAFGGYLAWQAGRGERVFPEAIDRRLYAVAVANTVYLVAFYAALAVAPVAVVAPIVGASPLFVVLGAALFLPDSERVTARLAAGAVLVVAGAALIVRG
jgi:drug/metabolite transporter (DMT)-like permease